MPITITRLHPLFCAEIAGVDTGAMMDDETFAEIRAALDEYSVLVFHDQSLDDEKQIAFSRRFGPLEIAGKANPGSALRSRGSRTWISRRALSFRPRIAA